jgi:gamma-glutamylcyclotransferase (GGCT)/AIG2-like uncharacterized protein YtfP
VGRLVDTGLDYPAATFGGVGVTSVILGRTYRLVDVGRDVALAALDHEEDTVAGLYRRVAITTVAGTPAWAYAYGTGLVLSAIESGDWFQR